MKDHAALDLTRTPTNGVDLPLSNTATVADVMSFGVQTVRSDAILKDLIGWMRRIGHEGYPVEENGRIVGLLTRRDADRAAEHGLEHLRVTDVMERGDVTVSPRDSIAAVVRKMVETGWGQIPVVDTSGRAIGIVTRTDILKFWANAQLATSPPVITPAEIAAVLGKSVQQLIYCVAQTAQASGANLYLVGGVVRDLLLKRRNLDIDFVVEANGAAPLRDGALGIAKQLQQEYGGSLHSFRPFGTAKWIVNDEVAQRLGVPRDELPDHVDFATARNEFYQHPSALPTVYSSSIKLDLQRRDFTINAIALQLSPAEASGRVLDFFGGLADLRDGLIRALHSLSFVEDPTRILRAIRFEARLGFHIEARTQELIDIALPMVNRITGERLRNELTLLLREDAPDEAIRRLAERGVLRAIHPDFNIGPATPTRIQRACALLDAPEGLWHNADRAQVLWHVLLLEVPAARVPAVARRLALGANLGQSIQRAAALAQHDAALTAAEVQPSQVVARLSGLKETALVALAAALEPAGAERVRQYTEYWRHVRPELSGDDLMTLGIPRGPCYSLILQRLRDARLDGSTTTREDEIALVKQWLADGLCAETATP